MVDKVKFRNANYKSKMRDINIHGSERLTFEIEAA
jgi:hypothetical protein